MTLVTTSRRPGTGLRAIARDLAFALKARYLPRGKHGLREITAEDPFFFVISQEKKDIVLRFHQETGAPVMRTIIGTCHEIREDQMLKGIRTTDPGLYSSIREHTPVTFIEGDRSVLIFDGPQRRRTILALQENEADA